MRKGPKIILVEREPHNMRGIEHRGKTRTGNPTHHKEPARQRGGNKVNSREQIQKHQNPQKHEGNGEEEETGKSGEQNGVKKAKP